MYEIFIYSVNVVYLNKCAHTIKSLNLTDSVQNVWQENIDCPFPFIISKVHVKRCMNFRYNSYIPHVRVSTFFYLMNWKGFVQLMRNLWQVEQVVACLNLALPADYSASIFFWWQFDIWDSWFLCHSIYMFDVKLELICNNRTNPV